MSEEGVIVCTAPSAPDCENPAVYNEANRCCGALSYNYCWEHLGPMLTGYITAWQDGLDPCPQCGHERKHLEDVVMLTKIEGMTLSEAWKKFDEQEGER